MERVLLAVASLVLGCGPQVETDGGSADDSASATTGSTTGTSSSSTGPEGSVEVESGVVDDGPVFPEDWGTIGAVCDVTPTFTCTAGVDCGAWTCGDPFSPFDASGCPRLMCPCTGDEVCFVPFEWGECVSSGIACEAGGGATCDCISDADCGGSYCLPFEEVPTAPCVDIELADECEAANCRWLDGTAYEQTGNMCGCDEPQGVCVSPLRYTSSGLPHAYFRLDLPSRGFLLFDGYEPVPLGLAECVGTEPVPVCECISSGC